MAVAVLSVCGRTGVWLSDVVLSASVGDVSVGPASLQRVAPSLVLSTASYFAWFEPSHGTSLQGGGEGLDDLSRSRARNPSARPENTVSPKISVQYSLL